MKRFNAILNDGSFINVPATRMEYKEDAIFAYDGDTLVAYVDVGFALTAHISERTEENARSKNG